MDSIFFILSSQKFLSRGKNQSPGVRSKGKRKTWVIWMVLAIGFTLASRLDAKILYKNYKVQKGDSLYQIARKFQITIGDLYTANPPKKANPSLFTGEILKIPMKSSGGSPPSSNPGIGIVDEKIRNAFTYPLSGKRPVLIPFSEISYAPHKGILFRETSAPLDVLASRGGVVAAIDYMEGYGNYIVLKHYGDYYSVYANIGKILVNEGQKVSPKQVLGQTESKKGLYFQISHREKALDPSPFIL